LLAAAFEFAMSALRFAGKNQFFGKCVELCDFFFGQCFHDCVSGFGLCCAALLGDLRAGFGQLDNVCLRLIGIFDGGIAIALSFANNSREFDTFPTLKIT
jgi:hypothetical protein